MIFQFFVNNDLVCVRFQEALFSHSLCLIKDYFYGKRVRFCASQNITNLRSTTLFAK